jgi:hypothetical protein
MNERMLIFTLIDYALEGQPLGRIAINRDHIAALMVRQSDPPGTQVLLSTNESYGVQEQMEQILAAMGEDINVSIKMQQAACREYGV